MHKIFLAGGKTGGPLSPLLSIVNHLDNVHPVIIDTNNSFGQITSQDKNYTFQSLPESKLSILSFNNSNFKEASLNFLKSL